MKCKVFLYFFVFLSLSVIVSAVGLVPAKHTIDFKPGTTHNFTFYAKGRGGQQTSVSIYMKNELSKYVEPKEYIFPSTVLKTIPEIGILPFNFAVVIPEDADPTPGRNIIDVFVSKQTPTGGAIGITTSVKGWLIFLVPYPGKYADIKLQIPNTNIDENTTLTLQITSRGKEKLIATRAIVEIRDYYDNLMNSFNFNNIVVEPGETKTFTKKIETRPYMPGKYYGTANYFYDTKIKEAETDFRVGTLSIGIINNTQELIIGKINEFNIIIENQW